MKLASFESAGAATYGIATDGALHAVSDNFRARFVDLKSALAGDAIAELEADALMQPSVAIERAEFLPVIPNPGRVICLGMNYMAHIREMGREIPEYPALFLRYPDSFVGHRQPIIRPRVSRKYDFEGELAFVVGRRARHVNVAEALNVVAGYTCLMEGTLRDYQMHTTQFTAGKNFTASGACGPWLVTTDDIPDPRELSLRTRVNGETMQTGEIADLCIDIPRTIEYLSGIFALEPGDIVATGTPAGVGAARKPPVWLQPGDEVAVEIDRVGTLVNVVRDEIASSLRSSQ